MRRSSRRFGHQSAIRPMRRWRGNGRFSPEGVKRRLGLAEAESASAPFGRGCKPGPDIEAPKTPSSPALRPGVEPPKRKPTIYSFISSISRRKTLYIKEEYLQIVTLS